MGKIFLIIILGISFLVLLYIDTKHIINSEFEAAKYRALIDSLEYENNKYSKTDSIDIDNFRIKITKIK